MRLARADLALLRWPALILGAACALLALLVWISRGDHERSSVRAKEAELAHMRARNELLEVRTQEANYRSFSSKFAALEGRGLTGAERRLDWIDTVQRLRERHRLYTLEYDVSAQRTFVASLAPPIGMDPRGSSVSLQLTTLHEGDLINFLDDLKRQAPGIFRQTRCNVSRLAAVAGEALGPKLNARCEYDWVTLRTSGS